MKNILVINAGSSSLKYQLFDMDRRAARARGQCERIGLDGRIKHTVEGRAPYAADRPLPDHAAAIRAVTEVLTGPETGVMAGMEEIFAVGHRVVHGGEFFSGSVRVTDEVIAALEACVPLAPLHNPPNLVGIRACLEVMPGVPQAAVFDTAFHQTMPPVAYLYAIPYEYYEKYKIRRYGFHGTSHRYVAQRAAEIIGKPFESLRIVTCHLGNGSSITAVQNGRSVDTSMGFTPLEGVPMGTRSGTIDPAILGFLGEREGRAAAELVTMLNQRSGVLGLSGVSSDFRDLAEAAGQGNRRAALALDIFIYTVKKYIGAYAAAMGGVDALVFTAGIGENNAGMRAQISSGLSFMGLTIDEAKNGAPGGEGVISVDGAPGYILRVPTNEELVIALDTESLVG
ncbi:MAG: acetate kinase [Oscillospiraceae bacterium]|jgi:acetate kinase|nr:acetate kinase [Oscillospiraceae bacterium]